MCAQDAGPLAPLRVVGTAGHVDHGKSTLIRALTGIDPDRLREERERGMTIDLGFAWLQAGGMDVGIVDVPGHQDLVRNMLAGVGGIDAVILAVAADESVMPQTREHLAILRLLGIDRGVIALTKRDLVDDEWAALAAEEVRAAVAATPLAGAPLVEVSAVARTGLDALVAAVAAVLGAAPERRDLGRPRLPIDRAFTMPGFGTVVTGTLRDGSLAVGDEVELVPGGHRARVRGLQTHRRAIERARPGSRVAANLAGVERAVLERGMAVVRPGTLAPSPLLGVRLEVLATAAAPLAHDDLVKVHVGTAEAMARVSVLEGRALEPGASGWVQLRLSQPVAAAAGDRLIVRRPSPPETLGGGEVADASAVRVRRRADAVAALERRAAPSPDARLLAALDEPRTRAELTARAGVGEAERDAALARLVAAGGAIPLGEAFLGHEAFASLATRAERALAAAHRRAPLRPGLPREELRTVTGLAPRPFAALVARLAADGRLRESGAHVALAGHVPAPDAAQEERWRRARAALEAAPLAPPSAAALATEYGIEGDLLAALAARGDLVRVAPDAVFLPAAVRAFGDAVVGELERAGTITVARARDLTGSSRRHVLPLLAFLDEARVTRRQGDDRILVGDPPDARERLARAIAQEGHA